jgi:hypothetical protein
LAQSRLIGAQWIPTLDHDPNGLDMTRDNRDRLAMFARQKVEVRRLALNFEQIEQYDPPPNFAKEEDSRYARYVEQYGDKCWELDALSPDVIAGLVREAVEGLVECEAWNAALAEEQWNRDKLVKASANWALVGNFLSALDEEGENE